MTEEGYPPFNQEPKILILKRPQQENMHTPDIVDSCKIKKPVKSLEQVCIYNIFVDKILLL